MFFDRLNDACEAKGTSPSAVAQQINRSKSNVTGWKRGQVPASDTLSALAAVLEVPTDFLLERPPFDAWEAINANRCGFLAHVNIDPNVLLAVFGIDLAAPDATSLKCFIAFLSMAISSAKPGPNGTWNVELKPGFAQQEAPAPKERDRHQVSDDDVKFALFGDAEIDDEVLDEVKRFAQFAREQRRQKEQQASD